MATESLVTEDRDNSAAATDPGREGPCTVPHTHSRRRHHSRFRAAPRRFDTTTGAMPSTPPHDLVAWTRCITVIGGMGDGALSTEHRPSAAPIWCTCGTVPQRAKSTAKTADRPAV